MIRRLVEAAILWEEGLHCGELLSSIPSEHADEAGRHAIAVFRRLAPGPTRNCLLEALVRRWPSDVLRMAPELLMEAEQAWVIQELMLHRASLASHEEFTEALLQLARGLKHPAWRSTALQSLMPMVPETFRSQLSVEIFSAARQLSPADWVAALNDIGTSKRQRPESLVSEVIASLMEVLRRSSDEGKVYELLSSVWRAAPDSQLPELFGLAAREWFARSEWFVELAVSSSDRAPALLGQAIQAAGSIEAPWTIFAKLAYRIAKLPREERPRYVRALWMEAQKARRWERGGLRLTLSFEQTLKRAELTEVVGEALSALEQRVGDAELRGELLRDLLPFMWEGLKPRALPLVEELEPTVSSRHELLAALKRQPKPGGPTASPMQGAFQADSVEIPWTPDFEPTLVTGGARRGPAEALSPALTLDQDGLSRSLDKIEKLLPPAEPVLLGTSAPAKVSPGDEFTARFVACVERLEQEVAAKLELLGSGASTVIGFQRCQWQLGSRLRVRVTSPHLLISPDEQEFVWSADASVLDFGVQVPPKARGRRTSLQFEVFFEETRVALLRHDLSVALWRRGAARRRVRVSRAPRTAFASFASDDRDRVLDRVASLRLGAGLDVFMDCLSLKPGEEWKKTLLAEIKRRELFLLFWSRHAQVSQWVEWEWRTALKHKKREAIQPHPLDPVTVAPPPKELAMLHFGDPYVMLRSEE